MSRLLGVLLMVLVLYGLLVGQFPQARSADNHFDLARVFGEFIGVIRHFATRHDHA